jgi:hypothetical protein
MYKEELENEGTIDVEKTIEKQFSSWFKKHVSVKFISSTSVIGLVFTMYFYVFRLQDCDLLREKALMTTYMHWHVNRICEFEFFLHVLLMVSSTTPLTVREIEEPKTVESWLRALIIMNALIFMAA